VGLAERGGRGTVDAHGKLLVANLFILAEKTATGIFHDAILNTVHNKTGHAQREISVPASNAKRTVLKRTVLKYRKNIKAGYWTIKWPGKSDEHSTEISSPHRTRGRKEERVASVEILNTLSFVSLSLSLSFVSLPLSLSLSPSLSFFLSFFSLYPILRACAHASEIKTESRKRAFRGNDSASNDISFTSGVHFQPR